MFEGVTEEDILNNGRTSHAWTFRACLKDASLFCETELLMSWI